MTELRTAVDAHEASAVNAKLASMFVTRPALDLDTLLAGWQRLLADVEHGSSMTIYDYTNDLSHRELLEELLVAIPASAVVKVRAVLSPLDASFMELSEVAAQPLYPVDDPPGPFWIERVPIRRVGEFEDDLRSNGHIA